MGNAGPRRRTFSTASPQHGVWNGDGREPGFGNDHAAFGGQPVRGLYRGQDIFGPHRQGPGPLHLRHSDLPDADQLHPGDLIGFARFGVQQIMGRYRSHPARDLQGLKSVERARHR